MSLILVPSFIPDLVNKSMAMITLIERNNKQASPFQLCRFTVCFQDTVGVFLH